MQIKKLKQTLEKAEALLIELSSKDIKDHEIASLKYEFKNLGVTDIDNKIQPSKRVTTPSTLNPMIKLDK